MSGRNITAPSRPPTAREVRKPGHKAFNHPPRLASLQLEKRGNQAKRLLITGNSLIEDRINIIIVVAAAGVDRLRRGGVGASLKCAIVRSSGDGCGLPRHIARRLK